MYQNNICEYIGLIASCNSCDRIIFEDENDKDEYIESGGYCKECRNENDEDRGPEPMTNVTNMSQDEFKAMHSKNFKAKYLNGDE